MPSDDLVMGRGELKRVREWALAKLSAGNEPPWTWYQLMKLREAIDALLVGMDATQPTGDLRGSAQRSGSGLQLVGEAGLQDSVQRHPSPNKIPLPT